MADAEHGLEFLEGGVGMDFDVGLKFLGVKLAPFSPALFRGERAFLGGRQIAVNRASPQIKAPGGFGLGTARVEEFDHPLPQVQRIGFHGRKPTRICAYVYMNCYSHWATRRRRALLACKKQAAGMFPHCLLY